MDLMQRYRFLERADFGTTGLNNEVTHKSTLVGGDQIEGENVSCSSADEARMTKATKETVQKPTLTVSPPAEHQDNFP